MDAKLTTTDDLDVSTGDLVLLTEEEAIAQHLRIRLRFFLGEWFLDERLGIPYFQQILVKNPSSPGVRSIFTETILETPGVVSIEGLVLTFDNADRSLGISFHATLEDSDVPLDFSADFMIG